MEAILASMMAAGYPLLADREIALYRYDPLSKSFPDVWRSVGKRIVRRYAAHEAQERITARILQSGSPLLMNDIGQAGQGSGMPAGIRAFLGMPVEAQGAPWGVLYVISPAANAFREDDLAFAQAMARQIGMSLEGGRPGTTGNAELSTVRVLAATVDAKDPYTRHHSANVSFYACQLARMMSLDPAEVRRIELAGLLHDIGKIAIPDHVLQKPGKLTPEERQVIQTHAAIGANILAQASHLAYLVPIVRHHHERYDGTGYPDGLNGSEIPLGAAIIGLADAFDTMTTRRVYRAPLSLERALDEIRRYCGTQFHPDVVAAMEHVVARAQTDGEPWLLTLGRLGENGEPVPPGMAGRLLYEGEEPRAHPHRDPLDFLEEARLVHVFEELPSLLGWSGEHALNFWSADAVQIYLADYDFSTLNLAWSNGSIPAQHYLAACRAEGTLPLSSGLAGWAAMTNQGISVPDARQDPRWLYGRELAGPLSVLAAPIVGTGQAVGVIQLLSCGESRFSQTDIKVLKIYSSLLAQAIERVQNARQHRELRWTDPLTGVRNISYLHAFLERQQAEATGVMSVAFLDGDDLKGVNDGHGPGAGDLIIQHIAYCLLAWQRPGDVVIRIAGDEFMIFFPGLNLPEASARVEQIRMAVAETPVELPGGRRLSVSVSCGVTEVNMNHGPHRAIRAAEQAMHNAKRAGKNRVWTVAG